MTKTAIIIGASSGIGYELAKVLSDKGYVLGLTARRKDLLEQLKEKMPNKSVIQKMDVSDSSTATHEFKGLLEELGNVDLVIISAGTGHINPDLDFDLELDTIKTNIIGFTALIDVAFDYFKSKKKGHIVGISSILALRGGPAAPAYSASKAYISNYMEALRIKSLKEDLNITVTDIRPGYVDTDMARGDNIFWMAPAQKAAKQIYNAIEKKKSCIYITKRWTLIGWILKILPDFIYKKL